MGDSVFIVMNEEGQVLAWEFTASTSIDEVTPLLKSLQYHLENSWLPSRTVFVDNCCQLRNKIKDIFGSATLVKLDMYHTIQRITGKLSLIYAM